MGLKLRMFYSLAKIRYSVHLFNSFNEYSLHEMIFEFVKCLHYHSNFNKVPRKRC